MSIQTISNSLRTAFARYSNCQHNIRNKSLFANFWLIDFHQQTNTLRRHYSKSASAMRFIRFERRGVDKVRLGALSADAKSFLQFNDAESDNMIALIASKSVADLERLTGAGKWETLGSDIKLLAPISNPEKIICIGLNYLGHCKEQNKDPPKEPMFFSKFASTITGPTGNVILHEITNQLDWEVELAVIIGKEARHVSKASAMEHVFGYSVAQDISARDWQKLRNGGQFLIGKSMDTFCPLGPAIVHKSLIPDPHNLTISCSINGVLKQNGNTNELIYRIDDIIHLLSKSITLKAGDVILTGTPSGVGMHRKPAEFLAPGDVIESEIESIGFIRNAVVADSPSTDNEL